MGNPTIEELQNEQEFELIAELDHNQIKEFVIDRLSKGGTLVTGYMVYQVIMILLGLFFVTRSIVLAFQRVIEPLLYIAAALVFCVTFLIVIHEILHGIAIKLSGAPKVTYGAYFKKFIFYAEADRFVINKNQFAFIALTPLLTIKLITAIAIIVSLHQPFVYFPLLVMCAHSLFCAGDIGLLSIFTSQKNKVIYTFDIRSKKKSYYYEKRRP